MAIIKGSRYENIPITTIVKNDISKSFLNLRDKLSLEDLQGNFFVHTGSTNEELDFISFATTNSPLKWWVIAYVNDMFFPLDELEGKSIIMPNKGFMSNPKKKDAQ